MVQIDARFAHGDHGRVMEQFLDFPVIRFARLVDVAGMYAHGGEHGIAAFGQYYGGLAAFEVVPDGDHTGYARVEGPPDYLVTVFIEFRGRKMGVGVEQQKQR